uniref:Uncharacterized protein n=1 Tax=viral metagenome TaxID=1070528 RepID=A0A6C0DIV6_9ZZZZ
MPIRVLVYSIEIETIYKIIDNYNKNKDDHDEPLERLDRCEDGFQIKIKNSHEVIGENNKIKQLRWKYKYLISFLNCQGFDRKEEMLLFNSMKTFLGENVIFET